MSDTVVEDMDTSPPNSSEGITGTPVQILDFDITMDNGKRTSTLVLKKDALDSILKKAGDREIVFISIAGPSRCGKSFLLGFMLRFLNAVDGEDTDWIGWDDPKKPLTGFKWRNGYDRETSGMWIWSEPFIVKCDDGKECAVLIMDTQGVFDEYTSHREWCTIVGLSLLTSSCLILNLMNNVQEDSIQMLDNFIQYGLLAAEGTDDVKPFQKLVFLLRDWNNPSEFSYGSKGGEEFIKKKLQDKPHLSEESRKVRRNIDACFEDVECFLMPPPGEVAKKTEYNGSLHGLDKKFTTSVEKFITGLLSPDELKVKTIAGTPIKANNLATLLDKYTEIFNCDEIPNPLTILEATARVTKQNLASKSKDVYRSEMQKKLRGNAYVHDKTLAKNHMDAWKKAEKFYKSGKRVGDSTISEEYFAILKDEVEAELVKYKESNQNKKEQALRRAVEDNANEYKSGLLQEIENDDFLPPDAFESKSAELKEVFTKEFSEAMDMDEGFMESFLQSLSEQMTEIEASLRDKNNLLRSVAKQHNEDWVMSAMELYNQKLQPRLENCQFMNNITLEELSKKYMKEIQDHYIKEKDRKGSRKFQKKFETKLFESLEAVHDSLMKQNQRNREDTELRMEKLVADCLQAFKYSMNLEFESHGVEIIEQLPTLFSKNEIASVEAFNTGTITPNNEINQNFLEVLNKKLTTFQAEFEDQCKQKRKEQIAILEGATRCALTDFDKILQEHVDKLCSLLDFDRICENTKEKVSVDFKQKVMDLPVSKGNEGLETLLKTLDAAALNLTDELKLKIEHAELKAADLVNKCKEFHQHQLLPFVTETLPSSEQELNELHEKFVGAAKQKFLNEGRFSEADDFTKVFLNDIVTGTDEAYEQLLELYRLKREESLNVVKNALQDAKKYYHEEMEKHIQSSVFLEPSVLKNCHKTAKKIAIKNCADNISMTSDQERDLTEAMEVLFISYKYKNDMNTPTQAAIGIDLGTTYSCVAVYLNGKVHVIPNNEGNNTTPSYVAFNDTCELVGEPAKNQAHSNPENTIFDSKRLIGRKFNDPKVQEDIKSWPFTVLEEGGVPKIKGREKMYHPEQISAMVLSEMKRMASEFLKFEVKNAVITVPAYFTDGQKQATIDAGTLAGLKVLKIIHEPTSAAVAYRLNCKTDECSRNVLIFDFGGGTFDVAVLNITGDKIDVKAINGDTHLGGEDFDKNIANYCVEQHLVKTGVDLLAGRNSSKQGERFKAMSALRRLLNMCEKRKCDLSSSRKVDILVDHISEDTNLAVPLTRAKFEDLNQHLFNAALDITKTVLEDAKMDKKGIDDIVLVGGSTRIPKIQQMLSDFFCGKALDHTVNQDEAVAFGAAVIAAIEVGTIAQKSGHYTKLSEVTPRSLGIRIRGGAMTVVIPKSTPVPTIKTKMYYTADDNQAEVSFAVYEGEDPVAENNHLLGTFYLSGVPPRPKGQERLPVEMEINDQGILHVTAKCLSNGISNDLTITEHKLRLTTEEIELILSDCRR